MTHRLHVGNLPTDLTAATLTEVFQRDGRQVARVDLVRTREIGVTRPFAFVDMATPADATAAIAALHGAEFLGRTLRVTPANGPKSRFGTTRPA